MKIIAEKGLPDVSGLGGERSRMTRVRSIAGIAVLLGFALAGAYGTGAQTVPGNVGASSAGLPEALQNVGFEPPLNGQMPLALGFRDETGRDVQLGDYFDRKPVLLAFVYYGCPMLCNQVEQGVVGSLKMLSFNPGRDYEVVFVSFDPRESPDMAAQKKTAALSHFGRPETADGWHFLTGTKESIDALTKRANFRYSFDATTRHLRARQRHHAAHSRRPHLALFLRRGVSRRATSGLGLVDASAGKIGTSDRSPVALLLPVRSVDRALQRHDSADYAFGRAFDDSHDRRGDFDFPAARSSRAGTEIARSTLEPCSRNCHCIRSRRPTSLPAWTP